MAIPIEYKDYQLSAKGVADAKKAWQKYAMMEYVREHGKLEGAPSNYENVPADMMEAFRRREYGNYYKKNYMPYLCFTANTAGSTISMNNYGTNASSTIPTMYYSTDGQNWTQWISQDSGVTFPAITMTNIGDKVYFYGENPNGVSRSTSIFSKFVMTGSIGASGDITTLIEQNGNITDLTGTNYCYYALFSGCTSLTTAPELPATTLAEGCYLTMFDGCTSLTTAPELPATTLTKLCYAYMFEGCTSLTTAPELPATTLEQGCYGYMFYNCTSLTTAPELPATTLVSYCYAYMFKGCTSLTTAPELPATTLEECCYEEMFAWCYNLNSIIVGATSWIVDYVNNWVDGVASTGTFAKPTNTSIPTGASGIPADWTVVNI